MEDLHALQPGDVHVLGAEGVVGAGAVEEAAVNAGRADDDGVGAGRIG